MDEIKVMEQMAADPALCTECHTTLLRGDDGQMHCAAGHGQIDGTTYEPIELVDHAPLSEFVRCYRELGQAYRDLRAKWAANREKLHVIEREHEALSQRIEVMGRDVAQLRERHRTEVDRLTSDLRIISTELYEEACNRDWCAEYDTFAERINGRTHGEWMQIRTEEHSATFRVSVSFKCRHGLRDDVMGEIYSVLENCLDNVDTELEDGDVSVSD